MEPPLAAGPGRSLIAMPGDFDTVKERVDIVQLVGERVQLRKAGRAYSGLCPFHAEKTPSFSVDPDRRTFHCWGCGEKGDVFDWLIKLDGVDKGEALKLLADRAGVELTGGRPPAEREREKRLLAAHDTAHFYFRQALRGTPKGKAAAEYVAARGIDQKMVEQFGVAYAPDLPDGLLAYLRKKGYSDEEVLGAGLVVQTERGLFDRFRDRLIVPIRDSRGRIIAFGGRAMRADQRGKYINSPQTLLFNKGATLYALDAAKAEARRQSEVVIVEGYFDAIACHQAGLVNVVASMGTALTVDQYRALDDLHLERAVVAFDGDAAGQRSAEARLRRALRVPRDAVGTRGTTDRGRRARLAPSRSPLRTSSTPRCVSGGETCGSASRGSCRRRGDRRREGAPRASSGRGCRGTSPRRAAGRAAAPARRHGRGSRRRSGSRQSPLPDLRSRSAGGRRTRRAR